MAKLSIELHRYLFEEDRQPYIKLADIIALAEERIFGFLFVILALPSALPVPAPGYSTPFGILLIVLAVQLIIGCQHPWLPRRMANHSIKRETVQKIVKAGLPWLRRLEAITQPRLTFLCTSWPGRAVLGCAIALMAASMTIPIPGTNTLPAIAVFVTGVGLVEDDGAISLGGLLLCCLVVILMASVVIAAIWGGTSLLDALKTWIKGLI